MRPFVGILLVVGVLVPMVAAAKDGPPAPANAGEFYITAFYQRARINAPDYEGHRLYLDDSLFSESGLVTLKDNKGYLLDFDTDSQQNMVGTAIGWAITDTGWDGAFDVVVRVAASAGTYTDSRENDRSKNGPLQPPLSGFQVFDKEGAPEEDPNNPGVPADVGLVYSLERIDGHRNADGTPGGFLTQGAMHTIDFSFKDDLQDGDLMVFLDSEWKGWKFTRGAGLYGGYRKQKYQHHFFVGDPLLFPGGLNPQTVGGDTFDYRYKYDLKTYYVGAQLAFSAGHRVLIPGLDWFVNGHFTPMLGVTEFKGEQRGFCFNTCNIGNVTADNTGVVKVDRTDKNFAFDLAFGSGMTFRLWQFRVTGQAGVQKNTGLARPRYPDGGESVKTDLSGGWGYYGEVSATLYLF